MSLLKTFVAEFVGTFVLVLIGLAALLATLPPLSPPLAAGAASFLMIAIGQGLAMVLAYACFQDISGAHLNPALTLVHLATRQISPRDAAAYVVAQVAGATLAAALCGLIYPHDTIALCSLGTPLPSRWVEGTTSPLGVGGTLLLMETLATFVFSLAWLRAQRPDNRGEIGGACLIGAAWAACILLAMPVSGAGLNPARAFGPALIWGDWSWQWLYWIAPLLGAAAAMALWRFYLSARS